MTITTGSVVRGKYRLEDSIGKGGMGEVFEATDLQTGQQVAIKVVSRIFADDLLMARLHREAEAARRIQSPHVPYLYEVDTSDGGELFLVMERLRGETLSQRLKRDPGFLTWDEVRRLGEDVLRGLIDAHAAGVIHRDLKPGNIFIEEDGTTRILDFGVCKLDRHDGESLTSTGEAVGTISYMAPEQIRGANKVDERADVYSFAMVIFEALSGRLAHDASGQIAMIASKLERAARGLREVARTPVPAWLDQLLSRSLSRKPQDRPASAVELLRAWQALGPAIIPPKLAPLTPMRAIQLSQTAETDVGLTARVASTAERRGTRVGLVVAAAALVAASVVLVIGLKLNAATPPSSGGPAPSRAIEDQTTPEAISDTAARTVRTSAAAAPPIITIAADPPDIDAGAASKPTRATAKPPARPYVPPRRPSGAATTGTPQIAVEPRY